MQIEFTPEALAYARAHGGAVTIRSVVISSCCGPDLPPEVIAAPPADADGFAEFAAEGLRVYYDQLLPPRERIIIDLRQYARLAELVLREADTSA